MSFDQIVYNRLRRDGIPTALALLETAKARFETGRWTSDAFFLNNNVGGYKWRGQPTALGPGLKSPEGDYYARYYSLDNSVDELAGYIKRRVQDGAFPPLSQIKTVEQYAQLLKDAGYYGATVSAYTAGLKTTYAEVVEIVKKGAPLLLLAAAGAIVYFNRKKIFAT